MRRPVLLALAAVIFALFLYGTMMGSRLDVVLGGLRQLEIYMDKPQTVTIQPCPPDGRIVVVVRAPGTLGPDWAAMAYRYATDRTWRGSVALVTKSEVWVWQGITVEVVTPRGRDESEDEWCKRHETAVADQLAIFPCD